jgi:asparagine synthase (glutamine-hydrolysing)
MEGILPREIIYRPKTGFGVPLRLWLNGPLRELLGDLLSAESLRRRGWFDADAVGRLLEADRKGRVDAAYPLFAVLCIELWATHLSRDTDVAIGSPDEGGMETGCRIPVSFRS